MTTIEAILAFYAVGVVVFSLTMFLANMDQDTWKLRAAIALLGGVLWPIFLPLSIVRGVRSSARPRSKL